jgi:hypothetical protein
MKKIYMPPGRTAADRRIIGCWLYQCKALLFIGERNPNYWVHEKMLWQEGVDWWVRHILKKPWEERTGWPAAEVERDFRLLVQQVYPGRDH